MYNIHQTFITSIVSLFALIQVAWAAPHSYEVRFLPEDMNGFFGGVHANESDLWSYTNNDNWYELKFFHLPTGQIFVSPPVTGVEKPFWGAHSPDGKIVVGGSISNSFNGNSPANHAKPVYVHIDIGQAIVDYPIPSTHFVDILYPVRVNNQGVILGVDHRSANLVPTATGNLDMGSFLFDPRRSPEMRYKNIPRPEVPGNFTRILMKDLMDTPNNEALFAVGSANDPVKEWLSRPIAYDDLTGTHFLETPAGYHGYANAVNTSGIIAGNIYWQDYNHISELALWDWNDGGKLIRPLPDLKRTIDVWHMNESTEIVGRIVKLSGGGAGYYYNHNTGEFYYLDDVIDEPSIKTIDHGTYITQDGRILASAGLVDGTERNVLLIPKP